MFIYAIQTSGGAAAAAHSRCRQDALLSIEICVARSVVVSKKKKKKNSNNPKTFCFIFSIIPEEQHAAGLKTPSG